ncbi:MAG: isochorismatase family protein [Methyloligellaceae bacterium]
MFVDLQEEYVASGRYFALGDVERSLANCRRLLAAARETGLAIAHFRQIKSSPFFNREAIFSQWIGDFRPKSHEMVFERDKPSCYCNASFENFMAQISQPSVVIAGLTGEQSCLATIIEAAHRGHHVIFAHDASASRTLGERSEAETHDVVTDLIGLYASVMSTDDVISHLTAGERVSQSHFG